MVQLAELQHDEAQATVSRDDSGRELPKGRVSPDQLAYMADMMAELQEMARNAGLPTLATLLGLSVQEAHRQISSGPSRAKNLV